MYVSYYFNNSDANYTFFQYYLNNCIIYNNIIIIPYLEINTIKGNYCYNYMNYENWINNNQSKYTIYLYIHN